MGKVQYDMSILVFVQKHGNGNDHLNMQIRWESLTDRNIRHYYKTILQSIVEYLTNIQ